MLTTREPKRDLGRIKFGKPTKFTIPVKNDGDLPIKIDKLVVGCGSCTEANVGNTMIYVGQEVLVNVKFTPGSVGPQTKHISVRYDSDQILRLEFTADVYA